MAVYELWRERDPTTRINVDAKLFLNSKNYISKAKRITVVETDEINKNYRLKIGNGTENHTTGTNGDNKMAVIDTDHQKRAEESNNMDLRNTGSKHSGTEVGQHTLKN
jgi:hypothetical protein